MELKTWSSTSSAGLGAQQRGSKEQRRCAASGAEAEIRRIMSSQLNDEPQSCSSCWLGVSPPSRAVNGLVQDANWLRHADRCSRSNLVTLREIDAQGEVSFMRCSSQAGDCRLLMESPELGLLSSAESDTDFAFRPHRAAGAGAGPASRPGAPPAWKGSCSSATASASRVPAVPLVCQTGFFVA